MGGIFVCLLFCGGFFFVIFYPAKLKKYIMAACLFLFFFFSLFISKFTNKKVHLNPFKRTSLQLKNYKLQLKIQREPTSYEPTNRSIPEGGGREKYAQVRSVIFFLLLQSSNNIKHFLYILFLHIAAIPL